MKDFCLLLNTHSLQVSCSFLWQCLPPSYPEKLLIFLCFLHPDTEAEFCSVLLSSIPSYSLCLTPCQGLGRETAKEGTFYWKSWNRLSFYCRKSHLLLQMASCPRQPLTITNGRHSILWDSWQSHLQKSSDNKLTFCYFSDRLKAYKIRKRSFFLHRIWTNFHLLFHV